MSENDTQDMPSEFPEKLHEVLDALAKRFIDEMDARLDAWQMDVSQQEVHEVIGALIARQITLAREFISAPPLWNEHIAPIILRCMAEVHITLAWIVIDPLERSRRFIHHGLGQEKLVVEHRRQQLASKGNEPNDDIGVKAQEAWIDSQRYTFLTEVNVGSWSGIDTRKMAEEAGCLDFYRLVYQPFSAAVHSMWNHVGRFNAQPCANPLHGFHRVAVAWTIPSSLHYLLLTTKYVEMVLRVFDKRFPLGIQEPELLNYVSEQIVSLQDLMPRKQGGVTLVPDRAAEQPE